MFFKVVSLKGKKQFVAWLKMTSRQKNKLNPIWKTKKNRKTSSSQAALSIVDDLNSFCKILGDTDLVSESNLVTRRFEILSLKNISQKEVTDYSNKIL